MPQKNIPKKNKTSRVPVATGDIEKAKRKIANVQNPEQAEEVKLWLFTIQKLFHKRGEFKKAFKASELWIDADRKLYNMLRQSGLTNQALADSLKTSVGAMKTLRTDLKIAYERPEEEFLALKDKAFNKGALLTRKWFIQNGTYGQNTKEQDWYTPQWVYERARLIMGSIDLDPASSKKAQDEGNKSKRYFTKQKNALKQDWGKAKNVFINPPFTVKDLRGKEKSGSALFFKKLLESDFKQAVFVTPEDSGTAYGQVLWPLSTAVFIQEGRLKFVYKGEKDRSPKPPSPALVWGLRVDALKFWLAFKGCGHVETRYKSYGQLRLDLENRLDELRPWIKKLEKLPPPPVSARRPKKKAKKP